MREIKYPAIYKHFKNNYYAVMSVSNLKSNKDSCEGCNKLTAYHTELNKNIDIYKKDNKYFHNETSDKTLVLYKALYDDKGIYARPLEMFISKVDKSKYSDAKQEFRFELID
ncbi:DUF1653 domain-containing protein [Clostridium tertium]|uniref:DUF1653 domain-containing protein n=1 Tax=Clostridium tertium TaxID=1559 RepID=A0A6N3FLN3_9CLOT